MNFLRILKKFFCLQNLRTSPILNIHLLKSNKIGIDIKVKFLIAGISFSYFHVIISEVHGIL